MPPRKLIPAEALSAETQKLMDVLNDGSDIAAILVASGFIDACLGSILERRLIASSVSEKLLDPRGGALGNYAARADLCYALGLINKPLFKDVQKIGEIRNVLAHSHLALFFSSVEVKMLCEELTYLDSLKNGSSNEPLIGHGLLDGPRNRFVITAVIISQRLLIKGLEAKNQRGAA